LTRSFQLKEIAACLMSQFNNYSGIAATVCLFSKFDLIYFRHDLIQ
jgi:hypothetical protein